MPAHDVQGRRIAWVGGALLLCVALAVVVAFVLLRHWRLDPGADRAGTTPQIDSGAARLSSAPQDDLARYRAEKKREAASSGWVDPAQGTVRIPIDDAMHLLATPAAPRAGIDQHVGAQLPMNMALTDSDGRGMRLADFFEPARAVIVVPGYYRCPELCGLVMHSLIDALQASGLGARDVRIVGISIDPEDTPATARQRLEADLSYAAFAHAGAATQPSLHLLVAPADDIRLFSQRTGLRYSAMADSPSRFAHGAGVIVATPGGRISRYLMGVSFAPAELRDAVTEAKAERIGTFSDRLALLCAHFDPRLGRHTGAVMNALRVLGVLLAASLALWCWRRRGTADGGRR